MRPLRRPFSIFSVVKTFRQNIFAMLNTFLLKSESLDIIDCRIDLEMRSLISGRKGLSCPINITVSFHDEQLNRLHPQASPRGI